MKGDIAFVGFMLTADEWQQLDTEARASLIAVATRRADPFLEPPRRLAEGTGKHEAVAGESAQTADAIEAKPQRAAIKIDIAGGTLDTSPDDDVEAGDELLLLDTELEQRIDLLGSDGEIEELRFEALDHEAALAAAAEMAAAGVAPPVAGESAPVARAKSGGDDVARAERDGVVQVADVNWAEADDDLQWAQGENWAKHGDVSWANAGDKSSPESGGSASWTGDDDLDWADL